MSNALAISRRIKFQIMKKQMFILVLALFLGVGCSHGTYSSSWQAPKGSAPTKMAADSRAWQAPKGTKHSKKAEKIIDQNGQKSPGHVPGPAQNKIVENAKAQKARIFSGVDQYQGRD